MLNKFRLFITDFRLQSLKIIGTNLLNMEQQIHLHSFYNETVFRARFRLILNPSSLILL